MTSLEVFLERFRDNKPMTSGKWEAFQRVERGKGIYRRQNNASWNSTVLRMSMITKGLTTPKRFSFILSLKRDARVVLAVVIWIVYVMRI